MEFGNDLEEYEMAEFRAFRALRPSQEKAASVAALPYDVVSREEARRIGEENKDSFLHVDRAEMDLDEHIDLYDISVYLKAKENLEKMEEEGTLVQDETPCFYIYELTRNTKVQSGIVGCSSIDDYLNGVVKKHELTREDKEQDRIRHVDICNANTGPIYLACRYTEDLMSLMEKWKTEHKAVYDFIADDGVGHRVWVIDTEEAILKVSEEFEKMESLYIADGHHRTASAVKVGMKRRMENPNYTGEEEFNYFMAVAFPYEQLTILPYNRVIKDLNGMTGKAFLGAVKFNYELMLMPGFPCKPVEPHSMGMYLEGDWYHLRSYKDIYENKDVVGQLDVTILQEKILKPILGIENPRIDNRVRFVGGNQRLKNLQELADQTGGVAFAMYPTSMEEIMQVADEGKIMPPKSTWFEPKLRKIGRAHV